MAHAAFNANENHAMRGGDVGGGVGEGFCCPFNVTLWWTAVLCECGAEEFEGDAVEEFFLVVTDDAQEAVPGLVDVFEGEEVRDGDVVDGLAFAVGGDVGGECVGELKAIGEMFADVDCHEGFEVV